MTYLFQVENPVPIGLSTDGGLNFNVVGDIVAPPSGTPTKSGGANRGLFRFVDQPTITAAHGEVWVIFNTGGPMFATGPPASGFPPAGSSLPGLLVPRPHHPPHAPNALPP